MTKRIIVHAGFHKTGTTTAQDLIRVNNKLIRRYALPRLKFHTKPLRRSAMRFSSTRDPRHLKQFARNTKAYLGELREKRADVILFSAEELCGHMPGWHNVSDYSAAPLLMEQFAQQITDIFPDTDCHFIFSTRDPQKWLSSAYWQIVINQPMTDTLESFLDRYQSAPNWEDLLSQIKRAVAPFPVTSYRMEDVVEQRLSTAQPLMNLIGMPTSEQAQITVPTHARQRPSDETLERVMLINKVLGDDPQGILLRKNLIKGDGTLFDAWQAEQ